MQIQLLDRVMQLSTRWRDLINIRRRQPQAPLLSLKAKLSLGQHHQLFLVEAGGRELMIATAPQSVHLLALEPRKDIHE